MFEHIVVGATDSEGATRALRRALDVARASEGTLHVVAATGPDRRWHDGGGGSAGAAEAEELFGAVRRLAAREFVRVAMHPVSADPVDAITQVAEAEGADLIVVGSQAAPGGRHLSHVPKAVMDQATCAVLVV